MLPISYFKTAKGFHLCHLNIRSLLNKVDLFRETLQNSNIKVCGISETWLGTESPNALVHIPGYKLTRLDRSWTTEGRNKTKKGGGICLYISEDLNFSEYEFKHLNVSCKDMEMQWILIAYPYSRDATHVWGKNRKTENIYFCHQWPFPSPKPLENRCRAFCCAELPLLVTPVWGKKENRKIFISVIKGPSLPPKPSQRR